VVGRKEAVEGRKEEERKREGTRSVEGWKRKERGAWRDGRGGNAERGGTEEEGTRSVEGGTEEERRKDGGNGNKEGIDWVRIWLEQKTIKQIESISLTLLFGSW
jgi:hypothetical protein